MYPCRTLTTHCAQNFRLESASLPNGPYVTDVIVEAAGLLQLDIVCVGSDTGDVNVWAGRVQLTVRPNRAHAPNSRLELVNNNVTASSVARLSLQLTDPYGNVLPQLINGESVVMRLVQVRTTVVISFHQRILEATLLNHALYALKSVWLPKS